MMASSVRQNYPLECEAGLNRLINLKLTASNTYLSMALHFHRSDVALSNVSSYFLKASEVERSDAITMMHYQNTRGGRVVFADVKKPTKNEWGSALDAMVEALQQRRAMNEALLQLHETATKTNDAQFCEHIEETYSTPQVDIIKETSNHITNLKRVGPGLGEYSFNKESLE